MDPHIACKYRSSRKPIIVRALAAITLVTVTVSVLVSADRSVAASSQISNEVAQSFIMSARHWNVPVSVLMATGYVESHWEQRPGSPSIDDGYGIMHITDRVDGTLNRAVALTGLTPDAIRTYPEANVEAGAALLRDISLKINKHGLPLTDPVQWYPVVAAYSGSPDAHVRDSYAQEVFRVIRVGARATLQSGETVVLQPSTIQNMPDAMSASPASDDYPPALWVPANPNNYQVGRPHPPIDTIIIHDTEGSYASAISWFQNPSAQASAHYVVRSSDGQITQMVRNANTAYQAGNWDYNVRAIGIEHEGYQSQHGWYTEAMYESSAALVRYMTDHYGIKKDRAHIIGHYQVPNQDHTDPGPYWDWDYYMSIVRRDSQRAALVDNTDPGFSANPPQIDPQHYWWTYSGGYNNSNTYDTTSVTYQSSSVNSAVWTTQLQNSGYYDVYAFIPYVDNSTADTSSAKYHVTGSGGTTLSIVSQKAITDVGSGSWANLGKYHFDGGQNAQVSLSDWTGETGRNVWFDAVMWIPSISSEPPPTPATTPTVPPSATGTSTPFSTPTPAATWTPGPCGMRFSDLPDTNWAYTYISYLFCNGVVTGYEDGTFRPNRGSTRAQFTKMLVLGLGWVPYNPVDPTFSDVAPGSTFYTYVEAAFARGAIGGYPDGSFRPNNPVTRAQAAKMLVLGKGWALVMPRTPTFSDVQPGHWAYSYVETAVAHNVIDGFADGTFRPDQAVTRGQLAKMVALTAQGARSNGNTAASRTPVPGSTPQETVAPKETATSP